MTALRSATRRFAGVAVTSVVAAGVTIAVAPPASAAVSPVVGRSGTGVTADTLPTAQIDGVVWSQAVRGDTVYAGGKFTSARPAGAAPGVDTVPRGNLMAYSISTGAIVSSFAPSLNGQVKTVTVSPDGTRVYVGGEFTSANGQNRYRIAAFDTATGSLVSSFAPGVNTAVNAIVATNSVVYVGGEFSNANGVARAKLAAFRAGDGALLGWAPTADNNDVNALVLTPDGSKLVVGGSFTTLNGSSSAYGLGAVDPASGALVPWAASNTVKNAGTAAAVLSLSTDGAAVYGTGYVFGAGGNLEGAFSADPSSGAINWIEDCHGDTYGSYPVNGVVYTVGHPHDCARVGGYPQTNPATYKYALGWTAKATGTLLRNQVGGYADFAGQPSPSLVNWFPELSEGSYTGQSQAAWSVAGNAKYIVLGGEFPKANGQAQQGLVRLAVPGTAPSKSGPVDSGYFFRSSETALSSTSVKVSWTANWDRDDQSLRYEVIRNGDTGNPVYTTTATSQFWNRPTLTFTDTSVKPGTSYDYFVRAIDPDGNAVRGDYTSVTTPPAGDAYRRQVAADGASNYWRLGQNPATDSIGSSPLSLRSGVAAGAAGAINGDTDTAATFTGTSTGSAATRSAISGPQTYSVEAWFKTSTTSGGKIVGFGSSRTGASRSNDRHLYLDDAGRVRFGTYPSKVQVLTSAKSYNDNAWHQVVATQGSAGTSLYVDGQLEAGNASFTRAESVTGYWRIGGDNLAGWPGAPSSPYLKGAIDDVSLYPTALSAAVVADHYRDSGR